MHRLRDSLHTARRAFVAAVVALAVAAPLVVLAGRALRRPVAEPASAATAAAQAQHAAAHPLTAPLRQSSAKRPALPGPGLPGSVVQALKASRIVVVSLYVSGDTVDMVASAEAEAGAALANVPFVPVNVADETQIGDLASRLPHLSVPCVLLVGPHGVVISQIDGYADRASVAGAVDTARRPS